MAPPSGPARPSTEPPGSLGRYKFIKPLGKGGMAAVYLAEVSGPQGFKKRVALKVVAPGVENHDDLEQMFFKEARIAAELTHPNIIQIYDFGEIEGRYFIAMEYAEGATLRGLLRQAKAAKRPLPPPVVATIGAQLSAALSYLHDRRAPDGTPANVIHRDISPENVFLTKEGFVKLIDFGVAKVGTAEGFTASGSLAGKPAYMSPEQAEGLQLDCKSDVFSLGTTLWECLAGRKLYSGELLQVLHAIINDPVAALEREAPGAPADLCALIMSALAKAPEDRPFAPEVQKGLERFLLGRGVSSPQALLVDCLQNPAGTAGSVDPSALGGYLDLELGVAGVNSSSSGEESSNERVFSGVPSLARDPRAQAAARPAGVLQAPVLSARDVELPADSSDSLEVDWGSRGARAPPPEVAAPSARPPPVPAARPLSQPPRRPTSGERPPPGKSPAPPRQAPLRLEPSAAKASSRLPILIGVVVVVGLAGAAILKLSQPRVEAPAPTPAPPVSPIAAPLELSVQSEPSGARVTVDGAVQAERTPTHLTMWKGESHTILVSLDRYLSTSATVVAQPGLAPLLVKLVPQAYTKVTSTPPAAVMTKAGASLGTTPVEVLEGDLRSGLTVTLAGWVPRQVGPDPDGGIAPAINVTLAPAAVVSVNTSPPGATLTLDGVDTGRISPTDLQVVAAKPHTLLVHLKGYLDLKRPLKATPKGRTLRVEATLHNKQLDSLGAKLARTKAELTHWRQVQKTWEKKTAGLFVTNVRKAQQDQAQKDAADAKVDDLSSQVDSLTEHLEQVKSELRPGQDL